MRTHLFQFTIIISLALVAIVTNSFVYAQTVDELKVKISSTNDQLQKLKQESSVIEKDLTTLGTQKNTLNTSIKTLDLTRKKLETDIKITQTKVDTTDLKIRQLGSDISYKEGEISVRIAAIKESLHAIYESDWQSLPQVALSNESFSGLWDDLESLDQFNATVQANIEILKRLKAELESKHVAQKSEKGKLLSLKGDLGDQKKVTEDTKKQKAQLLVKTSNQESKFQKDLKQKKALIAALEKEVRDYESTLKFILDPSSIPPRGTKVFFPPVDSVYITGKFGASSATNGSGQRLYASGTHNGTDFRASVGTPVKAMLGGIVMGTGNTDLTCPGASFGKWVLIDHQNGLASISAHLSLVSVSAGDTVATGQRVGLSGSTGWSTGPHLHISVYARKAVNILTRPSSGCSGRTYTMPIAAINGYLDPMDYL